MKPSPSVVPKDYDDVGGVVVIVTVTVTVTVTVMMMMMMKSTMSIRTTTKMMRNKILKIQKILRRIVWAPHPQTLGMVKRTLKNVIK